MIVSIKTEEGIVIAECDGQEWKGNLSIIPEAMKVITSSLQRTLRNRPARKAFEFLDRKEIQYHGA